MKTTNASMSATTIIAIILMTLKLLGKITLAWKWIVLIWLSPLAIALAFLILIVIVGFVLGLAGIQVGKKKVL